MSRGRLTILSALRASLPHGSRVLLAVSGGADSVALAHATASVSKGLGLEVGIAHIDHGLRAESREDAEWVSEFSAALGLQCFVRSLPSAPRSNIEAWARRERYGRLSEIRSKHRFDWILTAHTANDVAETLLMRLVTNKEPGSIAARDDRRRLIRPLLSISRAEIMRYLERHSLLHREDPSNESVRYLRNRVRHRILPHLVAEFGEGVVQSLAWQGLRLQSDLTVLRAISNSHSETVSALPFGTREWMRALRATLKALSRPVQLRVIDAVFSPQLPVPLGVRHRERVLQFVESDRVSVQLPSGIVLKRRAGGLEILPADA